MQGGKAIVNRTKIVATIGPASASETVMKGMILAGLDVARINFSHGSGEANLELISKIRKVSKKLKVPVAVLQDLQGPKLRVGELAHGQIELIEDKVVTLVTGQKISEDDSIPVPYGPLAKEVKRGDKLLLNDGIMELVVQSVEGKKIRAKVELGGTLLSNQGLAVPTASLSIESITEKDISDLTLGLEAGVDFVALSFVKSAKDINDLRRLIEKRVPKDKDRPAIIAKIEKHEAIDNFDSILTEVDGIMVARGDLGLETEIGMVPVTQKGLISKCVVAGKPVIVATHMLSSMVARPRPTRAEVSDVANAVLDHTDAVMLSEESAMGRYPVRTIKTMAQIIEKTEESTLDSLMPESDARSENVPLAVAAAGASLAQNISAKAILITTKTGYSARSVVRFRPKVSIFSVTDNPMVQKQLNLSWGIKSLLMDGYETPDKMYAGALTSLLRRKIVKRGDKIVVVSGLKRKTAGFDSAVRVTEA